MALILAIEPDRRQAARISALGRSALDAEVLVADSTEHGVAALSGRHPDLILTSLLLSPKDEAGLREFEKGGEPVPTLMIPVLAGSVRGAQDGGGLLARLHRRPVAPADSADGCDPAVFAAQIAEYLSRAHEEREAYDEEASESASEANGPELPIGVAPALVEARAQAGVDWEEIVIEEHEDGDHRLDVEDGLTIELSSETIDLEAFIDELKATYVDLFPIQETQRPQQVRVVQQAYEIDSVQEPRPILAALTHELPHHISWPAIEGVAAEDAPIPAFDDVVAEFVAALDESEPENPRGAAADSELWMPLSGAAGLAWPRLESTCSRRSREDEWGLYDPEHCGLAAVVAKLEQVTR